MKMHLLCTLLAGLLLLPAIAPAEDGTFHEIYVDAVWNNLTGLSSSQNAKYGMRKGQTDYYIFVASAWYDTSGTNLPFQFSARGTRAGVGIRQWFPARHAFVAVDAAKVIEGFDSGATDLRASLVGFNEWRDGKKKSDFYGDLTWVERVDDVFLNARYRNGKVLSQYKGGESWLYGVGQVLASGSGDNGTENRAEAGVGLGFSFAGHAVLDLEMRGGYSFRGTITKRAYLNPTVILAASF